MTLSEIMQWPTAKHIVVHVYDDGRRRVLKFRCRCGAEFEETFCHPFRVETAGESYEVLKEMHKSAINGKDWTRDEPRTAKQVRDSEGYAWLEKHGACGGPVTPS